MRHGLRPIQAHVEHLLEKGKALHGGEAAQDGVGREEKADLVIPATLYELRAQLLQNAATRFFPGFTKSAAGDEGGFRRRRLLGRC